MKQIIFISLVVAALFITLTAGMMSGSGKAGYTGSPGETTCNTSGCHNSFALNSGSGSVSATSNMNNWTYDPLTTYNITIKVAKTGVHLFGFGAELLNYSNINAGNLIIIDPTHTQIKSANVGGNARRDVTHKTNGGASQDSALFNFQWTSPDTTAGILTLYFVGNATNANGNESGDYIYSGTQVITPSSGNKVDNIISLNQFSVYPNPASGNISLHYFLQKNENVTVALYDLCGALAYNLISGERPAGENNETVSLPDGCRSGIYMLSIASTSGRVCSKLMVN